MANEYRTHNCGELRIEDIGKTVRLAGFVQKIRNLGKMQFIDLRDENGITQMQLDWSKVYGELSPGTYRVVKYNGLSILYSEPFIIK